MEKKNYDEYQIKIRHRLAFHTMLLTFVLIIANAFVKSWYVWAEPGVEAIVLVGVPTLYFVTGAVFKNAYISANERSPWATIMLFGLLAVAELFSFLAGGMGRLITDGRLSTGAMSLALLILFGYLSLILLVKELLNRREREEQ